MNKKLLYVGLWLCLLTCGQLWAEGPCAEDETACREDAVQSNDSIPEVELAQLKGLLDQRPEVKVLDVRGQPSFEQGHIPGSESFPLSEITEENAAKRLNKRDRIIVYCSSATCSMSENAAKKLISFGYQVENYKGGIRDWINQGQSLEKL